MRARKATSFYITQKHKKYRTFGVKQGLIEAASLCTLAIAKGFEEAESDLQKLQRN